MSTFCDWCEVKESLLPGAECSSKEGCDFSSLPMEPDAIIQRMKEEHAHVAEIRARVMKMRYDTVDDAQKDMGLMKDVAIGVQVMAHALATRFGYIPEQIQKEAGFDQKSLAERFRAKLAVAKFKAMRKFGG